MTPAPVLELYDQIVHLMRDLSSRKLAWTSGRGCSRIDIDRAVLRLELEIMIFGSIVVKYAGRRDSQTADLLHGIAVFLDPAPVYRGFEHVCMVGLVALVVDLTASRSR